MTGILPAADSSVDTDVDGGGGFIFSVRYIRRIRYANGADIIAGVVTAATKDLFSSSADAASSAAVGDAGLVFHPRLRAVIGSGFQTRPTVATGRDGTCVAADGRGTREKRPR